MDASRVSPRIPNGLDSNKQDVEWMRTSQLEWCERAADGMQIPEFRFNQFIFSEILQGVKYWGKVPCLHSQGWVPAEWTRWATTKMTTLLGVCSERRHSPWPGVAGGGGECVRGISGDRNHACTLVLKAPTGSAAQRSERLLGHGAAVQTTSKSWILVLGSSGKTWALQTSY